MDKSIFYTVTINGQSVTLRIADSKMFRSLSHAEQIQYVFRRLGIDPSRLKPKRTVLAAKAA